MRLGRVLYGFVVMGIAFYALSAFPQNGWTAYHGGEPSRMSEEAGESGGKVVIYSPKEGAVVSGDVLELSFEIVDKGKRGDHLHIFLNDKFVKPVYKKTYKLFGLKKGENVISIKLAEKDHALLGPEATVKVLVE